METDWVPVRLRSPLAALTEIAQREPAVQAAWVGGSLARGTADDWSDIDLHLLVAGVGDFCEQVVPWFRQALSVALADPIPGLDRAYLFISPDWIHVDVTVHDAANFTQHPIMPARLLFAREEQVRTILPTADEMHGDPYLPDGHATLFLYFMGLAVTQARREEWIALAGNAARLRDSLLVPLMLAENGVRKTDGANRLSRYLTSEQLTTLAGLPPIGTDSGLLLNAHVAIAHDYIARGQRVADAAGVAWPTLLEEALRGLWRRELDLEF